MRPICTFDDKGIQDVGIVVQRRRITGGLPRMDLEMEALASKIKHINQRSMSLTLTHHIGVQQLFHVP
jgi:hypothetical protein